MSKMMALLGTIAFALAVSVTAPVFAGEDLSAQISAAKTAADHEAIAAAYDKQAQEAEANAAAHDKMAASYKTLGKAGVIHETHCGTIAKRERESAKDLKALADAHRAQAKSVK